MVFIMNKTFKKIAASIMAVTTLTVSMTSIGTSTAEPRYGGYNYETYNGVSVEKYIDCSKTIAGGHTKCESASCSYAYVSVTANHSSTGSKTDYFFVTRGKASVYVTPDSGKSFSNARTSHYVTISGSSKWLNGMSASAGV